MRCSGLLRTFAGVRNSSAETVYRDSMQVVLATSGSVGNRQQRKNAAHKNQMAGSSDIYVGKTSDTACQIDCQRSLRTSLIVLEVNGHEFVGKPGAALAPAETTVLSLGSGGCSSFMQAFSRILVHLPLVPA